MKTTDQESQYRIRAGFDAFDPGHDQKLTVQSVAVRLGIATQQLQGALALHSRMCTPERHESVLGAFEAYMSIPEPRPAGSAGKTAHAHKIDVNYLLGALVLHEVIGLASMPEPVVPDEMAAQRQLLTAFKIWCGWGSMEKKLPAMSMACLLNSTRNPIDLGGYLKDETIRQWGYKTKMPESAARAIRAVMEAPPLPPKTNASALRLTHRYVMPCKRFKIELDANNTALRMTMLKTDDRGVVTEHPVKLKPGTTEAEAKEIADRLEK